MLGLVSRASLFCIQVSEKDTLVRWRKWERDPCRGAAFTAEGTHAETLRRKYLRCSGEVDSRRRGWIRLVLISDSQNYLEGLLKRIVEPQLHSFWISSPGEGLKNVHFSQVCSWDWCYCSGDYSLIVTGLLRKFFLPDFWKER